MIRSFSRLSALLLVPLAASLVLADDKKEPTKLEMTKEEQALLKLLNEKRAKKDLLALRPHPLLIKAAREQSKNMAKQRKMEHDLNGKKLGQRVDAAGYNWGKVSENLAMAEDGEPPLSAIVKDWMESAQHRENLLDKNVTETGVAIARNDKGEIYYTQIFARPRGIKPQK
ncbi:MAG TPA: CAP domain-containing protein [Gemmataceae bacterium]|nr:CAP domain-containing protein [Gemmataceae bacterium]